MYLWRQLTPGQREELLAARKLLGRPWHSPVHPKNLGHHEFLLTAACFEHRPLIGHTPDRMSAFSEALLALFVSSNCRTIAWCVLPNHYHALVQTPDIRGAIRALGQLHGRTSHAWNGEERTRGRRVFYRASDRAMRSETHSLATLNYVHHNPVHHGYVTRREDWPWSSAADYLEQEGSAKVARVWRTYPVLDYGKGWDDSGS
jgi:putative transposase